MPRMTAKYKGALSVYNYNVEIPRDQAIDLDNQEQLYDFLQEHGFFWNSNAKNWEEHDPEDADEPTALVMVRVWADVDLVEAAADDIARKIGRHYQLVERSKPYLCRPPKQLEARIYLKFLPKAQP